MARREPVPTPSALEKLEAPSREVAEARRRELAAEIAEKPGFKDALDTISKLENEQLPDGSPAVMPMAVAANGGPTSGRKNTEPRAVPRAIQQTAPSLARVLGEPRSKAADETITLPTTSTLPRIGAVVIGLALVAIAAWLIWVRDSEQPTPVPSSTSSTTTATATAKQSATAVVTAPVTAAATATDEPTLTAAASSMASTPSARSGRPSAKSASASVTVVVPTETAAISSKPPATAKSSSDRLPD